MQEAAYRRNGNGVLNEEQLARNEEFRDIVHNVLTSREALLRKLLDPRRDIFTECGFPADISLAEYRLLYEREAVAARVVDLYPNECWQVSPSVFEDDDPEVVTPFEEAWDELGAQLGPKSWHKQERGSKIWEALHRVDKLSGIGHYGVLLLGLDDGLPLSSPAKPRKGQKLIYLRVFDEVLAQVSRWNTDRNDPRFGHPEEYLLTFNDESTLTGQLGVGLAAPVGISSQVHWSRVIHVAEDIESSAVIAAPRMRSVFNNLLGLQKLYCGSPEMYWRGAFPGLSIETHPILGGDVNIDREALRTMVEDYQNSLQRYLALMGLTAKTLAPQVVDPTPQINAQIEAICIRKGCPKQVFVGAGSMGIGSGKETESLTGTWDDRVRFRQSDYLTPWLIAPFVDRLIYLMVLPEPGEEGYKVEWDDLGSLTDKERAEVGLTFTQAMAAYVAGGLENLISPLDYLTRIMGLTEEEASAMLEATKLHLEEANPDADDVVPGHGAIMPEPELPEIGFPGAPGALPAGGPGGGSKGKPKGGPPTAPKRPGPPTQNVFCATGEGGGVDPTCSLKDAGQAPDKAKVGGAVKEILGRASEIGFTDKPPASPSIDRRDYDEIEAVMTDRERQEMEDSLVEGRSDLIDEMVRERVREEMQDYEADVDEDQAIRDASLTHDDIYNDVYENMRTQSIGLNDWSALTESLNTWREESDAEGVEGIDEVIEALEEHATEGLAESLRRYRDESEDQLMEARDSLADEDRRSHEENLEESYRDSYQSDWDDSDDRREYLRNFWDDHSDEPRFSGSDDDEADQDRVWAKDRSGNMALRFGTESGDKFEISSNFYDSGIGEGKRANISFSDETGSYQITGKVGARGAAEVFRTVSAAVIALAQRESPDIITFTAAESSRQKLYDKLVKTVSKVLPQYSAVAATGSQIPKTYIAAKREILSKVLEQLPGRLYADRIEQLSNRRGGSHGERETRRGQGRATQARTRPGLAHGGILGEGDRRRARAGEGEGGSVRSQPQGLTGNIFCPTGAGGGVDPGCSPGAATHAALSRLKKNHGFTFRYNEHKYKNIGESGYSVSPYPQRTKVVNGKVEVADLERYIKKNKKLLSRPDHAVGAWLDGKTGEIYLDVVIVLENRREAIKLGKNHNQKAIFDFKRGKEISTGGTGKALNEHRHADQQGRHEGGTAAGSGPPQREQVDNRFCPTGQGGGIDPTCGGSGHGQAIEGERGRSDQATHRRDSEAGGSGGHAPPTDADGNVELTHWSHLPGLQTLDPERYGTGLKGAESARMMRDPENWVDRTYYGIGVGQPGGYRKEQGLGKQRYTTKLPLDDLYDIERDPDGLFPKQRQTGHSDVSVAERRIKDAGYKGYWVDSGGFVAAVFAPLRPEKHVTENRKLNISDVKSYFASCKRDEKGRCTASGGTPAKTKEEKGEGHGKDLEHAGHIAHDVHEAEEVAHLLGGIHELDPIAILTRRALGPAAKAAASLMRKSPKTQAAGEAVARIHEGMRRVADRYASSLVERYGEATAGAILGAGSMLSGSVLYATGVGPIGKAIPGQQIIGSIPLLALAETGKRLHLLGKDSKVEKKLERAGTFVHAVIHGAEALGKSATRAATRVARRVASGIKYRAVANRDLTDEEIQAEAELLIRQLHREFTALVEKEQEKLKPGLRELMSLQSTVNVFCATGKGGGIDPTCGRGEGTAADESPASRASAPQETKPRRAAGPARDTTVPPPPGRAYLPNVEEKGKDGVTKAARVGVPGDEVPPPPHIGRLPNLTPDERKVEAEFRRAFEADPDGMAKQLVDITLKATKPGDPPTFGTDDAKVLHEKWNCHPPCSLEERSQNRATLNTPLHQTANAVTKRAFLQHLDTLKEGDELLVTVGGCAAGKGYALKNNPDALAAKQRSKAVWDSAGDQNATENPWIQGEAERRGLKVTYLYVHADPKNQWANPEMGAVKRAQDPKDGRMVDAHVFADSHVLGAKNHDAFHRANVNNPNAEFIFLRNGPKVERLPGVPKEALQVDRQELLDFALKTVQESPDVPPHIRRGATIGTRIWGVPKRKSKLIENEEQVMNDKSSKAWPGEREAWLEDVQRQERMSRLARQADAVVKSEVQGVPALNDDGSLAENEDDAE